MKSKLKAVPCKIARGSFSGERVFKITLADGNPYTSLSSFIHILKTDKSHLAKQEPAEDNEIEGFIAARVVQKERENAIVELPDGELVMVSADALVPYPKESAFNVLVGS